MFDIRDSHLGDNNMRILPSRRHKSQSILAKAELLDLLVLDTVGLVAVAIEAGDVAVDVVVALLQSRH